MELRGAVKLQIVEDTSQEPDSNEELDFIDDYDELEDGDTVGTVNDPSVPMMRGSIATMRSEIAEEKQQQQSDRVLTMGEIYARQGSFDYISCRDRH